MIMKQLFLDRMDVWFGLVVRGIEPRASSVLGKHPTSELYHQIQTGLSLFAFCWFSQPFRANSNFFLNLLHEKLGSPILKSMKFSFSNCKGSEKLGSCRVLELGLCLQLIAILKYVTTPVCCSHVQTLALFLYPLKNHNKLSIHLDWCAA